jgi:hypothetical protein
MGQHKNAREVLKEAQDQNIQPDSITIGIFIKMYSYEGQEVQMLEAYREYKGNGWEINGHVINPIVQFYSRKGYLKVAVDFARILLREIQSKPHLMKDLHYCNTIIFRRFGRKNETFPLGISGLFCHSLIYSGLREMLMPGTGSSLEDLVFLDSQTS